jgi:hypothetical protein
MTEFSPRPMEPSGNLLREVQPWLGIGAFGGRSVVEPGKFRGAAPDDERRKGGPLQHRSLPIPSRESNTLVRPEVLAVPICQILSLRFGQLGKRFSPPALFPPRALQRKSPKGFMKPHPRSAPLAENAQVKRLGRRKSNPSIAIYLQGQRLGSRRFARRVSRRRGRPVLHQIGSVPTAPLYHGYACGREQIHLVEMHRFPLLVHRNREVAGSKAFSR